MAACGRYTIAMEENKWELEEFRERLERGVSKELTDNGNVEDTDKGTTGVLAVAGAGGGDGGVTYNLVLVVYTLDPARGNLFLLQVLIVSSAE